MIFTEKIQKYITDKVIVEIVTKNDWNVTGIIKELGDNYITVSYSTDREVQRVNEKGVNIEVIGLETSFLISEIFSISRIVSKSTR